MRIIFSIIITVTFNALFSIGYCQNTSGANVEQLMFENKKNNLPKLTGIQSSYLVKIKGLDKYVTSDLQKLSEKLSQNDEFNQVTITSNKPEDFINIISKSNCSKETLHSILNAQGFEITKINVEYQLLN